MAAAARSGLGSADKRRPTCRNGEARTLIASLRFSAGSSLRADEGDEDDDDQKDARAAARWRTIASLLDKKTQGTLPWNKTSG